MNKKIRTILIISVIFFGVSFLFVSSAQAGIVQFGSKQIFVDFDGLPFDLTNFAPGMSSSPKTIIITNDENFDINLYFGAEKISGNDILANALTVVIGNQSNHLSYLFNNNAMLGLINSGNSQSYDITIIFDASAGNEYQGKNIDFDFIITTEEIGKGGEEILPVVIPGGGGGGGGGTPLPPGLIIYSESIEITAIEEISVTIIWTTSYSATSQVIYAAEGENHTLDLTDSSGAPPKYGYAHTTSEYDVSPKVKNHSVTITGLTPGTTYYYRVVSHSSLALSQEYSFATLISEEGEVAAEAIEVEEEVEEGVGGEVFPEGAREGEVAGEVIEEGETPEGEEESAIILPEEGEEGRVSFLAAVGNIVTFGTGNIWIAIIAAIIVLAVLIYLVYYFGRKAHRKKFEKIEKPEEPEEPE